MQIRVISSCSCNICKNMCKHQPCIGTPQDIEKIIKAGYKDRLSFSVFKDEKNPNMAIPAIAPTKGPNGCVFLDSDGLCELHESGLKPTEGKYAHHDYADNGLHRTVAWTWISEKGIGVLEMFGVKKIGKLKKLIRQAIPFVKQGKIAAISVDDPAS